MTYAIETKQLTKFYGKSRGISNISLKVEKGDIFGYLGPNGARKSTSIRCLLGMIHPSSGEACILGRQIGRQQTEILKHVGYMPSETMFYPSMKAGDVIRYAAKVRGIDCSHEAKKLCDRLEIDTKKKISELSLGNRKKISIVCALQHKPDLLIFDEPTSGLDPLMQEVFFDLLMERNKEGTTCFLSSHVLPEVKKYCKHAGIIRSGELVTVDTVANLTRSNLRNVKITGITDLPKLEGMSEVITQGKELSFTYQGEMQVLISSLYGLPVQDFIVEEPSLEEVFMHFYE